MGKGVGGLVVERRRRRRRRVIVEGVKVDDSHQNERGWKGERKREGEGKRGRRERAVMPAFGGGSEEKKKKKRESRSSSCNKA